MAEKVTDYTPKSQNFIDTDLFDVSKHVTQTSGALVIGKRYTILDFNTGDNFTNVANVISGTINTTGCVFDAIGTTPTTYSNGSTLAVYETQSFTYAELKAGLGIGTKVYKALLTQSGNGTSTQTSGTLTIGKRYAITTFVAGDDFSNVATVVSGTINTTGCEFIATGTTPTTYTNGSTLTDTSAPVATVLVNTLSGTPVWGYLNVGLYDITLTGEFVSDKTFVTISLFWGNSSTEPFNFTCNKSYNQPDGMSFYAARISNNVPYDDEMVNVEVLIEVYP